MTIEAPPLLEHPIQKTEAAPFIRAQQAGSLCLPPLPPFFSPSWCLASRGPGACVVQGANIDFSPLTGHPLIVAHFRLPFLAREFSVWLRGRCSSYVCAPEKKRMGETGSRRLAGSVWEGGGTGVVWCGVVIVRTSAASPRLLFSPSSPRPLMTTSDSWCVSRLRRTSALEGRGADISCKKLGVVRCGRRVVMVAEEEVANF